MWSYMICVKMYGNCDADTALSKHIILRMKPDFDLELQKISMF